MAWIKLNSKTLVSAGDVITSTVFTSKKFIHVASHTLGVTGNNRQWSKLGKTIVDSGSNYAQRYSQNGGVDATNTSSSLGIGAGSLAVNNDRLTIRYFINITADEKLMICYTVTGGSVGAGSAPSREEIVGKWANTTDQFDIHELSNDEAGNFDTDSNTIISGTD